MFYAGIKSTVFRITAPGLSNRHVLFLCWKNYVSCYAGTSKYSSALACNTLDLFFLSTLQLNDTEKWTHLRSCLVKSDDCNNLSKRYKVTLWLVLHLIYHVVVAPFATINVTVVLIAQPNFMQTLKQYKLAELTPMESGCCCPPAEYATMQLNLLRCIESLKLLNLQLLTIILNMVIIWFAGVGTQLWTRPISIWAIIRWAPTSTASCTRMHAPSSATTVILASKLLVTSPFGLNHQLHFWCNAYTKHLVLELGLRSTWRPSGAWLPSSTWYCSSSW